MRASRSRILRAVEKELPISQEEQEERDALVDGEEESDLEAEAKNQKDGESVWIRGQNGVDREMKSRTTIKDLRNLDEGDRVIVRCNKSYVPNTKAAYLISSFLYDLATNDAYAPLSFLTWDNVGFDDYKIKMIRLVESKFLYHVNVRAWVLDKLNRAWRKYKGHLKKIYDSFATISDALENTPDNVNAEHWRVLVSDWCSEKKKKQCEINKNNCKNKKTYHTHGRKSLARKSKELEEEKDWDSPDRGTSMDDAYRKVSKSSSDIETCSVSFEDKYRDKKRKAIAFPTEGPCPVVEATPKKAARMKTSQVKKTPPSETITHIPMLPAEPAVPYKRRSHRLLSSTPSKQLPLSSVVQSTPTSSESKSKIKVPVEEALIMEEEEGDDGDGEDETLTPAPIIPPEPAVPYKRRSRRLSSSTPSKQIPPFSEMQSTLKSSEFRSKSKVSVEEALIVEEIEKDDGDGDGDNGSDDVYVESNLEASKSFSDKENGEDEEREEEKEDVEEAGAEMEGAPEETIAFIDQLVERVTRPSELAENEESITAAKKRNSKKGHEKKGNAFKEKEPSQPEIGSSTHTEEQPISVIPYPFEAHFGGASSSNPNYPTDNNKSGEILSHASQFEQTLKKVQDYCLDLRNLYFTNLEKLKVKDNSFAIISLKYGTLEEEAKVLREEKALLKQKVKELEVQLKEAEKSLPSEELEEKLLQLQLELNDAKSREIEAKRALAGKELEIIQKDNDILCLKARSRSHSRISNCTCNLTKSSASNPSEITKELVDQVMASDIFKSQQAIKDYEWMYYSIRCALIRAHFNLGIPSSEIWKIVTMHPNEAAIASETEGSILQYINHILSLWVQLMNKGTGSQEEQADFVTQHLQEVPFPFADGKEDFQYQKKQGAPPDPWYDTYDRSFGSPSGLVSSFLSAAAARSKDDELLWRFER